MFEHPPDSPFLEAIDNKIQSAENSTEKKCLGVVTTTLKNRYGGTQ